MCAGCQEVYGDKNETPPCDTCRPAFLEENADAIKIFYLVRNQLIMGARVPIDINHVAIHKAMDLYEVKDKKECFEKVLIMANSWFNYIREKGGM